ncbi:hypothetical protein KKB69_01815 [Patescibacteria group bacterium]|nr:hypothetical protein [Patescibacteria group bacterium]
MLYFVFGNDVGRGHEKFNAIAAQFLEKEKNLSFFKFDEESFEVSLFEDALKTSNLFSGKNLVAAKRLLGNTAGRDYILNNLSRISDSENIFIFFEEEVKKDYLDEIKKYTKNVWEFSVPGGKKDEEKQAVNKLFRLADLVALRKRNEAWLLFQKEVFEGVPAEEFFWKVLWQIKNLILVKKGGGKDLHRFVYGKAKRGADLFEEKELENFMGDLVGLYHKDRQGVGGLAIGLERFLLRI